MLIAIAGDNTKTNLMLAKVIQYKIIEKLISLGQLEPKLLPTTDELEKLHPAHFSHLVHWVDVKQKLHSIVRELISVPTERGLDIPPQFWSDRKPETLEYFTNNLAALIESKYKGIFTTSLLEDYKPKIVKDELVTDIEFPRWIITNVVDEKTALKIRTKGGKIVKLLPKLEKFKCSDEMAMYLNRDFYAPGYEYYFQVEEQNYEKGTAKIRFTGCTNLEAKMPVIGHSLKSHTVDLSLITGERYSKLRGDIEPLSDYSIGSLSTIAETIVNDLWI